MQEVWKTVDGFDKYEISNYGRLRSTDRLVNNHGGYYLKKGRILNPTKDHYGYPCFELKQDGKTWNAKIHRLVAIHFIPNPDNKPEVNHIDNNPSNPRADNLEWCTHYENMMWMHETGRAKRTKEWIEHLNEGLDFMRIPVIGHCIATGEEVQFESVNAVKRDGFLPGCVSRCCNGLAMTHHGYTWRFAR